MAYAYGMKGAPAVGGGLPGLPRRDVSPVPIAVGKSVTVQNWVTTGLFAKPFYIGSLYFDRKNAKLRTYVASSNNSGVSWSHYRFSWDVAADGVLTNFVQTYLNDSSSNTGGATSGGSRHVAGETYTRNDGKLLVNNGYSSRTRQIIDFNANTATNLYLANAGTYSNGGAWTTSGGLSDTGGSDCLIEQTAGHVICAFKDTQNKAGIQVLDANTGILIKSTTSGVATTSANTNCANVLKASWGYLAVFGFGTTATGVFDIYIQSFDGNYDYIGGIGPIRLQGTSGDKPMLVGSFLAADETCVAVFSMQELKRSLSKITFRLSVGGMPSATGIANAQMFGGDLQQTGVSDGNQFLIPVNEYGFSNFGKYKDFIAYISTARDLAVFNSNSTNGSMEWHICLVSPKLFDSPANGLAPFSAQIDQVLGYQGLNSGNHELVDYGDIAFRRFTLVGDGGTTLRMQTYKRNYTA